MPGRAGRHRRPPRQQEARQERQGRRSPPAGAPRGRRHPRVVDPANPCAGDPGHRAALKGRRRPTNGLDAAAARHPVPLRRPGHHRTARQRGGPRRLGHRRPGARHPPDRRGRPRLDRRGQRRTGARQSPAGSILAPPAGLPGATGGALRRGPTHLVAIWAEVGNPRRFSSSSDAVAPRRPRRHRSASATSTGPRVRLARKGPRCCAGHRR